MNSLFKVQNRKAFRDLAAEVTGTRRDLTDWLARATRGRRVGLMFPSNRQRRADEQAAAEAAAAKAEADRRAREDRGQWAEQAGAEHDPFAKQGS